MRVYLMRHATAEESGPTGDASRRLTDEGRREAREVGVALRERNAEITAILTSPRLRARQTAEIVASLLGGKVPLEIREGLNCGATDASYLAEIDAAAGEVLLVAHNPELSAFASGLVGHPLAFKPATICCVDDGRIDWLRHPSQA